METSLKDIQEFTLDANVDFRGEIYTTYKDHFLGLKFDHDKICTRSKNVLVGIHGDFSTTKLVTCLYGKVYCVLVDNRKDSIDYLKHKTFILSRENKKQLLIPPGIGNSFLVLSEESFFSGRREHCDNKSTDTTPSPKLTNMRLFFKIIKIFFFARV